MSRLFIPSKYCTKNENKQIRDYLNLTRNNNNNSMQGHVAVIHMTKDGKRELLPPTQNHIVLNGRRWVMQACMNQNFDSVIKQKDWTIKWFGVGNGGAVTSNPAIPLDTPDNTTELVSPIKIKPVNITPETGIYTDDEYKKHLYKVDDDKVVEMSYSESRGEVLMMAQLELSYDDCPQSESELACSINELALYASPTSQTTETNFVLFSRYCRPTIYKTTGDAYLFLWYIYF